MKNLVSILQEKQQQRLIPKFDDKENKKLNKTIKEISSEMTLDLKECQKVLKEIINDKKEEDNDINNLSRLNESSIQVKQNMKQNILTKLNEFTKKFKLNQEVYNSKFQDFVFDEEMANKSFSANKIEDQNKNDFLSTQENHDYLKKRDEDLTNLLNNINELAQIFKDMQALVMEQGTILDRIDYNIDIASSNVTKGKKSITKADKHMKNNCFRNVIIILIIIIFIEALLLIFKIF